MFFERYLIDVMEGRRKAPFLEKILSFLSMLYKMGIKLRNIAYDKKWLKSCKVAIPVISIGNISSGGVGKTPVVKKLAEEIAKEKTVAILTRGYRSLAEKKKESMRWKGEDAAICGDEPFWLASRLPQIAVWIGRDRVRSAESAHKEGADIILLDDGMQHRRLARDADIVVLDGKDLWNGKKFLPRGFLRDFPERLQSARLIVITRVKNAAEVESLRPEISQYTKAPIVGMQLKIKADLQGNRVGVFCAIGRPERFLHAVQEIGGKIVSEMIGLDHQAFDKKNIEDFAWLSREKGAELLVCTEKDGVKIPKDINSCLPILPLPAYMEIVAGEEHWKDLVEEFSHDRRI